MSVAMPAFSPAQESLFLTLGGRALDSRLPHPFLGDTIADEILGETGYDLGKFPSLTTKLIDARTKVFDIAVRAKRLDEVAGRFIERHPDAIGLDLGAGLDSRVLRINPPSTVGWYDVDFPQIVDLRRRLLPAQLGAHNIGADLTDPNWLDEVPADRPAVIIADGLVAFLRQHDFAALLSRLTNHFASGEIAFNLYTTQAIWATKHLASLAAISAGVVNPGFNDPRQPERWVAGLELAEEILLTRAPEVAELPLVTRLTSRLVAPSAAVSRMIGTTLVRYKF
ncbi:Leucine carboxyl methyltransferase [Mycobacterium marinum]|uniref:class I SAM-dependent methyltransferase n=1 Tax=Mycobacterium marinum TaxID=1781 RepID=UPI000E3EBCCF|nr:class I SAM-dependent methyltransferase [Mycobacterium marinum]RFZ70572.1 Leucine carboxyl methyltransferase [Mycobacterium marinum]